MATNLTNTTFSTTYKDDFLDSDNYHRILFNSGRALQARELTQMQTIANRELQRFGSNIFVDGGVVEPGGITVNNRLEYIKLATNVFTAGTYTTAQVIGEIFTVQAPAAAVQVKVVKVVLAEGANPDTLFVEYLSTSSGTTGTDPIRVGNSENLVDDDTSSITLTTASSNAAGRGTEASVAKGVFYVQGHFVFVEKQTIYVDKYNFNVDADLGFLVSEQIVTVDDDAALYDNQGANPNIAAPGADRYRIRLTLTLRSNITATDNFVYIAKIKNGKISDEARTDNSYNTLNDVLALRTKEESGNYTVKPFNASFESLDSAAVSDNLNLKVTDGIVYVDGYRLAVSPTDIVVPKARDTIAVENEIVVATYGNYVMGNISKGNMDGLPDIDTFDKLNLRDAVAYGGSTIGTARVRHIEVDGGNSYRFYLFDIRMNTGKSFALTRSFGKSSGDYVNVALEGGAAILKNTSDNNLLFPLPNTRPTQTGVSIDAITVQKKISVSTDGTGAASAVTPPAGYSTFTNTGQWIFADSCVDSNINISLAGDGTSFDISGGVPSVTYEALVQVVKSSPTARQKTLTETTKSWTLNGDIESDGAGQTFLAFDKADIYKVNSIKLTDSDGASIATSFTLDNGQRDNFYGIGRLLIRGGVSFAGGTTVFSRFQYFEHNAAGDFFDITSYPTAAVPYESIPSHTLGDGTQVSLRDVIDFRPRATKNTIAGAINIEFDSDGKLTGNPPIINALPANTGSFSADVTYYMPRSDRLVATTENEEGNRNPYGEVKIIQGTSSLNPLLPPVPSGSMPLYDITLNPYTLNESDLTSTFVPTKRFQMSDIADLENRIDQLQETTLLSLLEVNTSSLTVLDSAGLQRTKAGFLVDNFKDYAFTTTDGQQFRSAIDEIQGFLEPIAYPHNTRLIYDSATSTAERRGDIVTLPIVSEATIVDQDLATETENVNPFAVIVSNGHLVLSPQSDEWLETQYAPDRIVNGGTETFNVTVRVALIRPWSRQTLINQWIGRNLSDTVVRGGQRFRREQIGDRVIDVEFIPFMRARKIFFEANGLRRNTQHFLYFGGQNITAYAREESTFQRFATRNDNIGSKFKNRTSHPNGATDLITNSEGKIIGSFIIPANRSLKFRTGTTRVQLMDVTSGDPTTGTSNCETVFTSTGILNTRQRSILSTRIETNFFTQWYDPLAQSFRIDGADNPSGVFITKVEAFFSTKEATGGVPVQCQLRAVENGLPTDTPLPGAVKFVTPANVAIPSNLNDITAVRAAPTTFVFDEPIYLEPQREYCVVLLADTTAYNAYVAKTYEFIIGSTEQRVTKQPTMGSLFLSQNGITWTPDQTRDMMFRIYRAEFDASADVFMSNSEPGEELLGPDPISVTDASATVQILHEGHGYVKNDFVTIEGLDSASTYAGIKGSSIMGSRQIANVDYTGYTITADSAGSSTLRVGGTDVIATHNTMYDAFVPQITTLLPNLTSIDASAKLTSGSSFAGGRNTSVTGAYSKDASYKSVVLNDLNVNESPKIIATRTNEIASSLSGDKSLDVKLSLSTNDTRVSPVVDLQRNSFGTFENIIDNQDSALTNGFNVPLDIVLETHPTDGTSAAKHVTTIVTLEEPAVGLKVLLAANRPSVAGFDLYYRIGTSDANLTDLSWIELPENSNNPADEDPNTFREYEYLAGGIGGFLNAFTQFQLKIVFRTTNTSKSPKIKDLRAIALVT